MEKRLAKNAILNTISTALVILFPLITYPYVSRVLGVEKLGIYNFSYSFLSYFLLIAALGISTYGIREGIRYREDGLQFKRFVSEVFSINIISTGVAYILLFFFLFAIPFLNKYAIIVLILSAEIILTTLGVPWVCNVFEDFFFITIRTIVMQVVSLVLIFVCVRSSADLYKYALIVLISNSSANLLNFFYVRRRYCRFCFTIKIDWRKHLKPILIIFSSTVAITIYVSSDTTILGFMTNDYQVGLYGTAVKIYAGVKAILSAVVTVLIPHFTMLFSKGDRKELNAVFSRIFNSIILLMLPMCVGLFTLSEDIVLAFSGDAFARSAGPLRLLCVAIFFSIFAFLYVHCILIPNKKENVVFRVTAVSALVNIGLNFILIPLLSINAAAITTIIAEMIVFTISYSVSKSYVSLVNVKGNIISIALGCAAIYAVCALLKSIEGLALRIGASVGCSVFAYLCILLLTRNPVLIRFGSFLNERRKNMRK